MAGSHQHPIPDNASDNSSDNEELDPTEDSNVPENLSPQLQIDTELLESIIEMNIAPITLTIEPMATFNFNDIHTVNGTVSLAAITANSTDEFQKVLSMSAESQSLASTLLFSSPAVSNGNQFASSMVSMEKKTIASIIEELSKPINDDEWFSQFRLALESLQRIKDYAIIGDNGLEEAADLAATLSTKLNLSEEHSVLIREDLEKPVVDSIDFLFNTWQMTAAYKVKPGDV